MKTLWLFSVIILLGGCKKEERPPQPFSKILNNNNETDCCVYRLIEAVNTDDLDLMKKIIEGGCDVNGKIKEGVLYWTCPLYKAIPNIDLARYLLEKGANPNLDLGIRETPFQYCIAWNPAIFELLYQYGGDVNKREPGSNCISLLDCAITIGQIWMIDCIVEKGAELNPLSPKDYSSPLATALHHDQFEIAKLLIAKGANVNAKFSEPTEDCFSQCPHEITVMHSLVSKYTWQKVNGNLQEKFLDLFLKNGADVTIKNRDGETPIDWAVAIKDTALANRLIQYRNQ